MLFKNMIIRLSSRIKQSFSFRKRVSDLEDMVVLQKHMILDLEEENTKLRDTVIESVDLVSTYKVGMEQMKHYLLLKLIGFRTYVSALSWLISLRLSSN